MKKHLLISVAAMVLSSGAAHAALETDERPDHKSDLYTADVYVGKSDLDMGPRNAVSVEGPRARWDLDVTSWNPKTLNIGSQMPETSGFHSLVPQISLSTVRDPGLVLFSRFKTMLSMGGTFLMMKRTGVFDAGGIQISDSQTALIGSARLTAQFYPIRLTGSLFSPYVEAGIEPTVITASRSAFNIDGATDFGVPVLVGLGTQIRRGSVLPEVKLGLFATRGMVRDSDFNAIGLSLGLRY